MVYLSYYEKYPIYEPSEGGYYYAGIELVESERMSLRKAKATMKSWLTDDDIDEWTVVRNFHPNTLDLLPGMKFKREGEYIGEGCFWVIERKKGCFTKGRQIYC